MSSAAKTILKPVSMATSGCFVSVQSIFTPSKASFSYPSPSILFKPLKFGKGILLPLGRKEPLFRFSAIASEEDSPVALEEQEQGFDGNLDLYVSEIGDEDEVGFSEPSEEAKVYVGNLPYDVDSEKLAQLFEQAGVVEISEVIYNRETDRSRGFGFVTMSTVEDSEKAVDMFHKYDLNGRLLTVNKAAPRGSRPERPPREFEPSYRIYVANLPWDVDDSGLEELFSEHGKVVSARVVMERETGRSRGFGFVQMASESEMNDAIASLDGQSLDGRAIRVNVAEERPRRGGF